MNFLVIKEKVDFDSKFQWLKYLYNIYTIVDIPTSQNRALNVKTMNFISSLYSINEEWINEILCITINNPKNVYITSLPEFVSDLPTECLIDTRTSYWDETGLSYIIIWHQ